MKKSKRKPVLYEREVEDAVELRLDVRVVEALGKLGWNAFGVYEVVKDELNKRKKALTLSKGCTPKQSTPNGGGSGVQTCTTVPDGV